MPSMRPKVADTTSFELEKFRESFGTLEDSFEYIPEKVDRASEASQEFMVGFAQVVRAMDGGASASMKLGAALAEGVGGGIASAVTAVITGTETIASAFKNLMKVILSSVAQALGNIIGTAIVKIISSAIPVPIKPYGPMPVPVQAASVPLRASFTPRSALSEVASFARPRSAPPEVISFIRPDRSESVRPYSRESESRSFIRPDRSESVGQSAPSSRARPLAPVLNITVNGGLFDTNELRTIVQDRFMPLVSDLWRTGEYRTYGG